VLDMIFRDDECRVRTDDAPKVAPPHPLAAEHARLEVRAVTSNARPEARKEAARLARAAPKAVANGADEKSGEEF
jgi:hypothetical protein